VIVEVALATVQEDAGLTATGKVSCTVSKRAVRGK
jgi:hypothetical protein